MVAKEANLGPSQGLFTGNNEVNNAYAYAYAYALHISIGCPPRWPPVS